MKALTRDFFLDVEGVRFEARWVETGSKGKPALVFLHEGLGSVSLWRDFPNRLARATGCPALVFSRQGYGGSDAAELPRPLTFHRVEGLQVLPKVLDAAGIEDFIIVGHSDGASIAIAYAGGTDEDRLKGLILEAPHVFNEDKNVNAIRALYESWEGSELRRRLMRHHGDNVDGAFLGWARVWLDPEFLHFNMEDCLPHIKVPTLIIQGEQDEYGTSRQYEAISTQLGGPCEVVVLDDCRHSPHRDQEKATLEAMTRFIEKILEA
jgi:pimeloyl-ACP methyl ester carboxylesterase